MFFSNQKIIGCRQGLLLDPAHCRAQTYDAAGNMTGVVNGCAANLIKIVPQAHYYHCTNHSLNMALSKTCNVPDVPKMMSTLQTLAIFLLYSSNIHRLHAYTSIKAPETCMLSYLPIPLGQGI